MAFQMLYCLRLSANWLFRYKIFSLTCEDGDDALEVLSFLRDFLLATETWDGRLLFFFLDPVVKTYHYLLSNKYLKNK